MSPPASPALPAEPERPRVPRALYAGLQGSRRAPWSPETIKAWWAWCVARTDPATVAGVEGGPVLFLTTPAMVAFVAHSRDLDVLAYALTEKAPQQRRWAQYCQQRWEQYRFDVMTPQLLLESLEGCVGAGSLSRAEVSRMHEESLKSVNAQGRWKPLTPSASPRAKE